MAAEEIECHVCGAGNPKESERCSSCGARLSELASELSEAELYARRHQPDGFEVRWVFISFGLFLVMAALALALLPLVVPAYDPQGFAGIVITIVLWFLGAAAINYVSPGKNFIEPPVGGLLAAIPTMTFLSSIADVYQLSVGAYVLGTMMATMMALMGAFVGNLLRADHEEPRPQKKRSRRPKAA
ncbi:MAG: zinc ribbon domain-containing protein [Deltaproteobacteria bacterium]|nr:zinc ribbon domain-containing protein [Deltaproteobacteria bacterium]MBW2626179.1 zinc ribbon domain-containing protein [Deltaproteobacteria bacterium]MBW2686715.1 zinc ribbon domain-containing protein [Deltaproteobacteria bacterium]